MRCWEKLYPNNFQGEIPKPLSEIYFQPQPLTNLYFMAISLTLGILILYQVQNSWAESLNAAKKKL